MATLSTGILDEYSIKPRNLTQYTAFRGVTDFTQIGQFNQFETGYSFLSVIEMPRFITELADKLDDIRDMANSFQHMLEYEFRGLTGLPDVTGETFTITDGNNEQNIINRVVADTSIEVSMSYFEKSGGLITRFAEYYLTGIKDRMSQAKHYHGLIKNGLLEPGYENEVFTFLYYVTDNTMLRLERAYLLCNAQLNKAETSMYDSTKGEYNNREIALTFNCFPVWGSQVNKAAKALLEDITGVNVDYVNSTPNYSVKTETNVAALDSNDYLYGIMDSSNSAAKNATLVSALGTKASTWQEYAES